MSASQQVRNIESMRFEAMAAHCEKSASNVAETQEPSAETRSSAANTVNARTILQKTWEAAQAMLRLDHSPEQASGRLQLIDVARISHETIYLRNYADKGAGGDLSK